MTGRRLGLILFTAALVVAAPSRAQTSLLPADLPSAVAAPPAATTGESRPGIETLPSATSLAGPVDPTVYRLGPGDRLVLHLRGPVTRDVPVDIGPEGDVIVPEEGVLAVAGRTLGDVRDEIERRVARRYRNVVVQLRLLRPRAFRIYLTGQVSAPGPAQANGSFRVADVLTPTMLLPNASQRNIEVIHADGTREACDLQLFLHTGAATWNPWLRDGDVVQVPPATRYVHCEGAVAKPGRYELGQRDSVRTLLRLAGGALPSALADRVLLVRFEKQIVAESLWVSLNGILAGSDNYPLEDGERVYVYFIPKFRELHQVTILGEVHRPGTYPVDEGRTHLRDLISSASGLLPSADVTTLRVHRAANLTAGKDPELERLLRLSRSELTASEYEVLRTRLAGMREDYSVDWDRLQKDPSLDLLLRDGDVVRVERRVLSIRVDGEVRRPGLQNFVPGRSIEACVLEAGGYSNRAWRNRVRVTRAVTGQTLLARDVRSLDPGDFIWVPERTDVTAWERFRDLMVVLSQVATIVIAVRSVK